MASTKLYLDQRNKRASVFPVCVCVSANNTTILIPTGVRLHPNEWKRGEVVQHPDKGQINAILRTFRSRVDTCVIGLQTAGRIKKMKPREIKESILQYLDPSRAEEKVTFAIASERFLRTKTGRTLELYNNTLKKISCFCNLRTLTFEELTPEWLERYVVAHGTERVNTTAIDLRNIRAIVNYARRMGWTKEYPFLNYKIRREKTRHRNNPPELLCALRGWDCEPHQRRYRDIFLLIFYLLGINIGDLCLARNKDVIGGRLEYKRKKTKKMYSILLQPEAREIIARYQGREYLLDIMERVTDYRYFAKALNRNIRQIGKVTRKGRGGKKIRRPIMPEDTTYWMRHSWATIAHRIGIPKDTISMALGHSFGVDVTDTYIDYDNEQVDKANRRVLDYLASLEQTEAYKEYLRRLIDGEI